jgi:DNA-binding LacI/PurR family transcriptional regulator
LRAQPTIKDVARLAGVSPATVSNVLGGRRAVDAGLAERVRAAAAELGYEVHRAASQLRSGRTRIVAMLVPSLENPFFTALVAAMERCTRADGYELIVASSGDVPNVEASRLAALLAWRPTGVIVIPCDDAFASRSLIAAERLPYAVVDRVAVAGEADTVALDNRAAARTAAEHLLGLGHRHILVAASSLALANIRERCAGVEAALAAVPGAVMELIELGPTFESAAARMAGRVATGPLPSGAVALTNQTTLALLAAFHRTGLRVPDDVSLVGFDDYAWMLACSPSVTAVRQPVDAMATEAWRCLLDRIRGSEAPPLRLALAAALEIRQSTRAVGALPGAQPGQQLKRAGARGS